MKSSKAVKLLVALSAAILATVMVFSYVPVRGEERIYTDVIRLHVLANSDGAKDQEDKLAVRDAVLDYMETVDMPKNTDGAEYAIKKSLSDIKRVAVETLEGRGVALPVEVVYDREEYPVRYYEGFTLPAGEYASLRIVIGEGEGHNWWCVLFPPLCTAAGEKEQKDDFIASGFTSEQYSLIKNGSGSKYKVRFKILEILSDVFGFDY